MRSAVSKPQRTQYPKTTSSAPSAQCVFPLIKRSISDAKSSWIRLIELNFWLYGLAISENHFGGAISHHS